jgi:hypothetical protein
MQLSTPFFTTCHAEYFPSWLVFFTSVLHSFYSCSLFSYFNMSIKGGNDKPTHCLDINLFIHPHLLFLYSDIHWELSTVSPVLYHFFPRVSCSPFSNAVLLNSNWFFIRIPFSHWWFSQLTVHITCISWWSRWLSYMALVTQNTQQRILWPSDIMAVMVLQQHL